MVFARSINSNCSIFWKYAIIDKEKNRDKTITKEDEIEKGGDIQKARRFKSSTRGYSWIG